MLQNVNNGIMIRKYRFFFFVFFVSCSILKDLKFECVCVAVMQLKLSSSYYFSLDFRMGLDCVYVCVCMSFVSFIIKMAQSAFVSISLILSMNSLNGVLNYWLRCSVVYVCLVCFQKVCLCSVLSMCSMFGCCCCCFVCCWLHSNAIL